MKISGQKISLLVSILTIMMASAMYYSYYRGQEIAVRFTPLMDAAKKIKIESTTAHLWFEEAIGGDSTSGFKDFQEHIDLADWYAHAMLDGGQNKENTYIPLNDPNLRYHIEQTIMGMNTFREIAHKRWEAQSTSGIGSDIEQVFDQVFRDFIVSSDHVDSTLHEAMAKNLRQFKVEQTSLIIAVLLIGLLISIILNRYNIQSTRNLKALHDKEERLRVTLNSIGDAVITTDINGDITRMNPVAENLTGWTFQEANGVNLKVILPIIDATSRDPIENPVEKVLATGHTVYLSNHTTLVSRNGTEYQIADSAAAIRSDTGEILGMVLVFNDVTEAYRLREKANSTQRRLQRLFDDMKTMVVITDIDGTVNFTNNTPLVASGIEREDVIGKKIWDCAWFNYDPEVQAIIQNDCLLAYAGENILRDIQIAGQDGKIWIAYSLHPVRNDEGQITQILHEGRDISKRKETEDNIRTSEQHLKLYREQTPIATIEWDTNAQVIDWNKAAEKMFGYRLDEVKGRSFIDIMLPDYIKVDAQKVWENLIQDSGGTKNINENKTKDGRIILCEWHNTPLKDESGTIIGAASLVLDITAQHHAQQALLAKEHEQKNILDFMVDSVLSIDETGKIISFNKAAETLFGYHFNEIIGQNISQLMPATESNKHDGYIQNYHKTDDARVIGIGREVEGLHKDGHSFPMRMSITELPKNENGVRRYIGTCQDLTQIKQQEEQLRRTQKMDALGKLTGGIAHDFNNILGVIVGYSDLLAERLDDQPKLAEYVTQIHHAGERGAKLTKKLLSFTRDQSPEATQIDLNKLLLEQKDLLQKTLTVRIELVVDLDDNIWPIWLDSHDMEDAILNISINAMHAMNDMKSNSKFTISTSNRSLSKLDGLIVGLAAGDYVQLAFTDTGVGIDKITKEKIFDPFFSTKGDKGTGLGLSQVFGFVKRAGGIIKVYSELGQGTKFELYFPRHIEADNNALSEIPFDNMDLRGTENILVVDDEESLRDLASELLKGQGYTVFCAESGEMAMDILKKEHIDLMLSDIVMPETDGYELAAQVQEKYPNIKIQMTSGFTDDRHTDLTDQNLHQNILRKPYNTNKLFENIRNLLNDHTVTIQHHTGSTKANIKESLTRLEWTEDFSVGVAEIDNDHKILLSFLNRCIDLANGKELNDELDIILEKLVSYTAYHFQREERIMEICEFPLLQKHKRTHRKLISEINRYKAEYNHGTLTISPLLEFLTRWFKEHIMIVDKTASSYFAEKKDLIQQEFSPDGGVNND